CRKTGATAYMGLLSAAMILLGKYSRQEDIVIGSPISGRTHKDTEQMLGMFVNTLAMRGYPERDKKYLDFLKEVRDSALKAYENQEYPFEELVEELGVQRELSRNPLFDVMFVMQNNESTSLDIDGTQAEGVKSRHTSAKFDMTISITETEDGCEIDWEYCTDMFELETIKRMLGHFSHLVDELTENPEKNIGELSVVGEEEKKLIVETFNGTAAEYPSDKTVVELFEEQAGKTPDNIAVVFEEEKITYGELNAKANQLAYKLRALGVRPDDRVAIISQRGIGMIIGIYGIIKAGGAYVPIDPDYPEERIKYMLEDCRPKAVLSGGAEPPETDIHVIDIFNEEAYAGETRNPVHVNTPNDLIYIIYTSGTTGKPKGVMIEHKSIIRVTKSSKYLELDEATAILQIGALSFDASTFEIWGALLNGGRLYMVSNEVLTDPFALKMSIQRWGINTMLLTTALYNHMISEDNEMFDSLKYLLVGGEKLSEKHVSTLKDRNSNIKFINCYGPTESTTFSTMYEVPARFEKIPIGKPIANTRIYIMNGNELCGAGIPGELCITGTGLARGYLNLPALTAEKFTPNPFGEGKMYRSGDLARWLPDGNIEFLGRIDSQVKIRGFRIELVEIENVILKQSGIKDVAVTVRERNGDKSICAYVVSDEEVTLSGMKDALRKELPEYMIPAFLMQIRSIPVTRNGKVDKDALPEPGAIGGKEYIAPESKTEAVLAGILEDILGVPAVGLEDNFFELGGDSIKAIRVVSKMREAGYTLTVRDLMQLHIVKLIAEKAVRAEEAVLHEQGEVSGQVPLTPIQHMFFSWNYPKAYHFNQAVMICCKDGFDKKALEESLKALVIHHDALRSVYAGKVQRILPVEESGLFDLKEFDIRNIDNAVQMVEKESTDIQSGMDIQNGPLVKVGLFHAENGDHLLLCLHHLVVDGVSWRIILEDLSSGYELALMSKKIILPSKTASYKAWSEALSVYARSKELKKEVMYWHEIGKKAMTGGIQGDLNKSSGEYAHIALELEQESTYQLLYEAGKAYGTEINDLLLSALGMAVKQWKGQDYLTAELEGHGREEIGKPISIDRTVGWFTSIYPIVVEMTDNIRQMIISTKEMLRRIPNHGAGYAVAKYLGQYGLPDIDAAVSFNYLGEMDSEIREDGRFTASNLPVGLSIAAENAPTHGIAMNGSIINGRLKFTVAYNSGRYSEQSMKQFCSSYVQSIKTIVQHCRSQKETVKTASDFGASDMSLSDFELLLNMQDK
ncbi:MAG TPA: amino acid adenylation domain-containing protein, partial [Ruminiclostridium sp.]|nr:amino acid adenylation domain-containing protein [Ruminiclostridium sp.]